ncbi:MAG: ABC transporter substrate-binding protein [Treponema sp.]|nr:ABC transporter substrate-binding protein [Treponema sp.]
MKQKSQTHTGKFARGLLLPLLPVLLFTAAGCIACHRQSGAFGNANTQAALRFGFPSEPATLDPLNPANTADGRSILFNVFEGLVKPDSSGRLQPAAAESWHIGQDCRSYDFHLRGSVLFHDGSILNSDDVKFTLETAMAAGFTGFSEIDSIETPGALDIRINLKQSDPEFLPYLTVGIVKAGSTDREKHINGTGPFSIESYNVQRSLVLKRFPGYWQGVPPVHTLEDSDNPAINGKKCTPLDTITIVFLTDSNALVLALQGGGIDGAGMTGSLVQQLDPHLFDITPFPSASVQLLALNNAVKPLDDIRVRKAINYSIDIRGIIDAAFFGSGDPSGSPLIPGLEAYYDTSLRDPYPRNIEQAKSLLALAGYGDGKGQKKLSLEITVPSIYSMHVDTAQVIAGQLQEAGINAVIKQIDWASWLSDVYRDRKYEATVISLDAANVSPRSFLSRYRSDADNNFINFHNADFDRVYDASLTESNDGKRAELYKEAQHIISDSAASVYIQDITGFRVFRGGEFGGAVNYPLYVIDFAPMYRIEK